MHKKRKIGQQDGISDSLTPSRAGLLGEVLHLLGYRAVALYLSGKLAEYDEIELISDGGDIPVFAFRMTEAAEKSTNYTVFDMSERLRDRGWQLPYTFPKNCEHVAALRVVVKEGFNRDLADLLLGDFERHMEWFKAHPEHKPKKSGHSFPH